MLTVIYSCNDKVFEGLYLSILSMLNRTKETIHFYCLTGSLIEINKNYKALSKIHISLLNKLVKKYNKNNVFEIVDCANQYRRVFNKANVCDIKKYTPYAVFRLLLEDFKQIRGVCLYIDVDTMVNGDIKEAFNVNMVGYEACVCHDRNKWRKNKHTYFNSGVMLWNLDVIRQTHYLTKALNYYFIKKPKLADQDALNMTWTKIKFWKKDTRFNYQKPWIESDTVVKHFLEAPRLHHKIKYIKQWDIKKVQTIMNIHNWDEDYKMFLKNKKNWKK